MPDGLVTLMERCVAFVIQITGPANSMALVRPIVQSRFTRIELVIGFPPDRFVPASMKMVRRVKVGFPIVNSPNPAARGWLNLTEPPKRMKPPVKVLSPE